MIFKKLLTHHFLKVGSFLLIALYPFIIYISLQYFQVKRLSLLFLVIFLLHLFVFQKKHILNNWGKYSILLMIISIILLSHLFNHAIFLKLYPVLMSLIFFSFFTYSIFYPPSLIESIARIKNKNLPSKAISYTRFGKKNLFLLVFFKRYITFKLILTYSKLFIAPMRRINLLKCFK